MTRRDIEQQAFLVGAALGEMSSEGQKFIAFRPIRAEKALMQGFYNLIPICGHSRI